MSELDDVLDDFHFAVMEKNELKQQNADLVAALEDVKKRLRFAQFPSTTQGLLDIQKIIEQALVQAKGNQS